MACLLTRLARDDVQHFALSIQLASSLPDPSPAPHLYLAQLAQSPQESLAYFASALAIFEAKLAALEQAKLGGDGGAGTVDEAEDEGEIRRSASRALVGMTELYLTDLWCVDCFRPRPVLPQTLFKRPTLTAIALLRRTVLSPRRSRTAKSSWPRRHRWTRRTRRCTRCVSLALLLDRGMPAHPLLYCRHWRLSASVSSGKRTQRRP